MNALGVCLAVLTFIGLSQAFYQRLARQAQGGLCQCDTLCSCLGDATETYKQLGDLWKQIPSQDEVQGQCWEQTKDKYPDLQRRAEDSLTPEQRRKWDSLKDDYEKLQGEAEVEYKEIETNMKTAEVKYDRCMAEKGFDDGCGDCGQSASRQKRNAIVNHFRRRRQISSGSAFSGPPANRQDPRQGRPAVPGLTPEQKDYALCLQRTWSQFDDLFEEIQRMNIEMMSTDFQEGIMACYDNSCREPEGDAREAQQTCEQRSGIEQILERMQEADSKFAPKFIEIEQKRFAIIDEASQRLAEAN